MVSQGRSCQGLAPFCRRRWIYRPPITSDVTNKTTRPSEHVWAGHREKGQFLIYLLLGTLLTEPVVQDVHNAWFSANEFCQTWCQFSVKRDDLHYSSSGILQRKRRGKNRDHMITLRIKQDRNCDRMYFYPIFYTHSLVTVLICGRRGGISTTRIPLPCRVHPLFLKHRDLMVTNLETSFLFFLSTRLMAQGAGLCLSWLTSSEP